MPNHTTTHPAPASPPADPPSCDPDAVDVEAVIRALADPLRMRIVDLLATEPLCTCHLVEMTGARQTNVSNHMRVLREAGLITAEPAGRYTYYRLRPQALTTLAAYVTALAGRGAATATVRRPCP